MRQRLKQALPYLGPAFIASVAYVDPGNFATNIEGGARFGYLLVWVIIAANLMGMFIQFLSAKLGIATGQNLAELCRDRFSKPVAYFLWVLSEIVAMATDVAEFVGAALGFHLLFGMPLFLAGLATAVCTFGFLAFERKGYRPLEIIITGLVAIIVVAFAMEVFFARPNWGGVAEGILPRFSGGTSVYLATGILGATVMPHVIFLHSALTQRRVKGKTPKEAEKTYRYQLLDVVVAMGIAGLINLSMLIMAAAVFHAQGLFSISEIEPAYHMLDRVVGRHADWIFGIALLSSGLSSSTVGTLAGQVMMQGFIRFRIPLFVRRTVTMLPSLIILAGAMNTTQAMILSQVVLSFGIPFAAIPLFLFTKSRTLMGIYVNRMWTNRVAVLMIGLVIVLNGYLLYEIFV